jgi:hypothetical protein
MLSIPKAFMRNAYSKAVSSQCTKRPPSPKWPVCILVLRITEPEQVLHVISLTFATHLAASQTPTLPKKKREGNEELTRTNNVQLRSFKEFKDSKKN